jgi:hypothetical protein
LTEKKPRLGDILKANRLFIIVLLSLPLVGMIIAAGLVLYTRPDNMIIALAVIFFLMVQYGITVYILIKRLDSLARRGENNNSEVLID